MNQFDFGAISIGGGDFLGEFEYDAVNDTASASLPKSDAQSKIPPKAELTQPEPACPFCATDTTPSGPPETQVQNDFYFERCEDAKVCNIGETVLDGQGRILDVTMRLKNVCPGKRVAVGITLTELDAVGNEHPRGLKTFTVPAHSHNTCKDIPISSMRFILPEDISVGIGTGLCSGRRHFVARAVAHYVDTTGSCCNS